MSVLDHALRLRAANHAPLLADYSTIILRVTPEPSDAGRLLEIMDTLKLADADVRADIIGVGNIRADEMPLANLQSHRDLIHRHLAEVRKKLESMPTGTTGYRWPGPRTPADEAADDRASAERKIEALNGDVRTVNQQIDSLIDRIAQAKWKLPRVFGPHASRIAVESTAMEPKKS